MTEAVFRPIPKSLAYDLIGFIDRRNLGKSLMVGTTEYTLDFISYNTSAFFQSRGLSVYFRTARSVVRISDHWGSSVGFEKSRKLNCGLISGKKWIITDGAEKVYCSKYAGKYPFEMLAGKCGLASLNRTCDHWSA